MIRAIMGEWFESIKGLMERGGLAMWPLLALSVAAVTLIVERAWFWLQTNGNRSLQALAQCQRALRKGDVRLAEQLAANNPTVYGRISSALAQEAKTDAAAVEAIEAQRPRMERFMSMLSTIITVAPMLGILGTVVGIIKTFRVFSLKEQVALSDVSGGIAEALWSTAAGLVVAIFVLFPYNAFRTQLDRSLGRIETLLAASREGRGDQPGGE